MNHHDALDFGMFWTGAMFAFTPIIIASIVLVVWRRGRRRQRQADQAAGGTPAA